ncbi:uncharacterized protein LOC131806905 [Musca domestica]|uniref:Uncharacterized protein LOC131806905 n=1 Tax=Musca domestica TaxID=7370 RepID=A0ABM3VPQ6_MUSDO|nr:uncharacterized protein LOC131806905 [Musca domestica]
MGISCFIKVAKVTSAWKSKTNQDPAKQFLSLDNLKVTMNDSEQGPRTKAFYKQQWQLLESMRPCSVRLTKLSEEECHAAPAPAVGASVGSGMVKQRQRELQASVTGRNPPKRSSANPPARKSGSSCAKKARTSLPKPPPIVLETIVLSSDDDVPTTPPRRARDCPNTPSPVVSPMSVGSLSPTLGRGIFLGTDLPPTPGRNIPLSTSPRYAPDSDSDIERNQPRVNHRLEQLRSPKVPTVSSVVVIPPSPPNCNTDVPFECRETLPDDIMHELQSCLREALRRAVPHQQYKRIFMIRGQRLRVQVNRQGKVFVAMR